MHETYQQRMYETYQQRMHETYQQHFETYHQHIETYQQHIETYQQHIETYQQIQATSVVITRPQYMTLQSATSYACGHIPAVHATDLSRR